MPDFVLEEEMTGQGYTLICGVDEAGRGPWAGPVVAGAVVLDRQSLSDALRLGLDDSKKLKPPARAALFEILQRECRIGVGLADVEEIDRLNILQATMLAMRRAVEDLGAPIPDLAFVDGNREPQMSCDVRTVVKGDALSLSIAAGSIVAKVTRDSIMAELDVCHPGYGWAHNAGYGTAEHKAALDTLGVTPVHRKSFAPIRKMLSPDP
ncbi:MAG: ribonuclease HII [Rhodospirillaceae bacterium]|jgi:ribonuclease HII|nr:ribonuclease HII [Rhodospirillaceae bacterium]